MPAQESAHRWNVFGQKHKPCQAKISKAPIYRQMGALGWGCTGVHILLGVREIKGVQEEKSVHGCAVDVARGLC